MENKTGVNGIIGGEQVARAPTDGYTLLLVVLGLLKQVGATPVTSKSEAFAAFTRSELDRYAKLVRVANIAPE